MKIYDSFLFYNELDILEIRLNELNNVVDYFILVESSVTHQGQSKPFIFDENKERFAKFEGMTKFTTEPKADLQNLQIKLFTLK